MPVEWEEMESAASRMFNIWADGTEFSFARECWQHLKAAKLAEGGTIVERTQTALRLLALRLIYGDFCEAKWDEPADADLLFLSEDLNLDPLALGLLAADGLENLGFDCEDRSSLLEAALSAAVSEMRSETFDCIRSAYGGQSGLYERMSQTSNDGSGDFDFDATGNNLAAYEFCSQGVR